MTIAIFANGDLVEIEWVQEHIRGAEFVIAANGGLKHLQKLGYRPDLIIGDLDSAETEELIGWDDISIIRKPVNKDETDLELALIYATQKFDDEIKVFGAMGGRMDQMLANTMLLAHPRLRSKQIYLVEPGQRAWLVGSKDTISGRPGDIISLIPLDSDVKVEATSGFKWPLQDEKLTMGASRGVSNELVDTKAEIQLSGGLLLCIHLDQKWQVGF